MWILPDWLRLDGLALNRMIPSRVRLGRGSLELVWRVNVLGLKLDLLGLIPGMRCLYRVGLGHLNGSSDLGGE